MTEFIQCFLLTAAVRQSHSEALPGRPEGRGFYGGSRGMQNGDQQLGGAADGE